MEKMRKTALLLMLITIISKLLGFLRDIVLAYYYGTNYISDAYLISQTIPFVIFTFIATGISTGFIPIYTEVIKENGEQAGNRYTNNLINLFIIICTLIVCVTLFFTEPIVKVFAIGFEGPALDLAIKFTQISIFGIYFTAIIYICNGFLQVKNNYILPVFIGIPLNIIIVMSIYFSVYYDVSLIVIGNLLASAIQVLILVFFLYRKNYRYSITLDFKDKYLRKSIIIALPVILGTSVTQINILIDRTIASQLNEGSISALTYANTLKQFVIGIFVTTITTIMFPQISKMAAADNMKSLRKLLQESIGSVSMLVIPASIGFMIFAEPIVRLLYGRGSFDSTAIELTSTALFWYSIGLIGFGLKQVLSYTFYSLQDTKTPMINATISVFLNIILSFILSKYMGVGGLAFGTSLSALLTTILLYLSLKKKMGHFGNRIIVNSLIKITFSSCLMGIISKLIYFYFMDITNQSIALFISVFVGIIFYFLFLVLLKVNELKTIVSSIRKKFGAS